MSKWNKTGTQLLPKVREAIYAEAVAKHLGAFERQPNGEFTLELGAIEGRPVRLIVNATVSGRDSFEKKTPKAKEVVEVEAIDIDALFD